MASALEEANNQQLAAAASEIAQLRARVADTERAAAAANKVHHVSGKTLGFMPNERTTDSDSGGCATEHMVCRCCVHS